MGGNYFNAFLDLVCYAMDPNDWVIITAAFIEILEIC